MYLLIYEFIISQVLFQQILYTAKKAFEEPTMPGTNGRLKCCLSFKLLVFHLKLLIKDSVNKVVMISNILFLVKAHARNVTHIFFMSQPFLLNIFWICSGSKLSRLLVERGCVSTNRSIVNDSILWQSQMPFPRGHTTSFQHP